MSCGVHSPSPAARRLKRWRHHLVPGHAGPPHPAWQLPSLLRLVEQDNQHRVNTGAHPSSLHESLAFLEEAVLDATPSSAKHMESQPTNRPGHLHFFRVRIVYTVRVMKTTIPVYPAASAAVGPMVIGMHGTGCYNGRCMAQDHGEQRVSNFSFSEECH